MAFKNRIRLPMKITRPQFPEERQSFRKANGQVKTLSVVVRKTYEGETDYLPELWHQRLKIALAHDTVIIEGEKYIGEVAQDGEYTIDWPDFMDYPTAKAEFTVQVTPFDATNANCQSCEEALQLSLEDDTFPDPLEEEETYGLNLSENDSICCYPAAFSLQSYNADYLSAATLNPATGELSVTLKDGLVSANGLLLATYRVTCPNGGYDEANVYANVSGSTSGCLAPPSISKGGTTTTSVTLHWTDPGYAPAGGYDWEIRTVANPGVIVQSGNTSLLTVTISSLDPNTAYTFYVRSNCGEGDTSNQISTTVTTLPESEVCGSYEVGYNNGSGNPSESANISVRGCDGIVRVALVYNMSSVIVCAQQTSPGNPVQITGPAGTSINYVGLC